MSRPYLRYPIMQVYGIVIRIALFVDRNIIGIVGIAIVAGLIYGIGSQLEVGWKLRHGTNDRKEMLRQAKIPDTVRSKKFVYKHHYIMAEAGMSGCVLPLDTPKPSDTSR